MKPRRRLAAWAGLFLVVAACGSGPAAVAPTDATPPPSTTLAPSTTATSTTVVTSTTAVATTTTSAAPIAAGMPRLFARAVDQTVPTRPTFTMWTIAPDGTTTVLWTETNESWPMIHDISADLERALVRRLDVTDPLNGDFLLFERDLASGKERAITSSPQWIDAAYVDDGSGDVLVSTEEYTVDANGFVTSTEGSLRRLAIDGTDIAELSRRPVNGVDGIVWVQGLVVDGQEAIALAGKPMTLVAPGGAQLGEVANAPDGWCVPVRALEPSRLLARCLEGDSEYFNQLWSIPLDGGDPTQVTRLPAPEGPDFGAYDVWITADGTQWVQRMADCGGNWVEELQPDGRTEPSVSGGTIFGVAGNRLVIGRSGACEGNQAEIGLLDPRSGVFRVLLASESSPDLGGGLDLRNIIAVSDPPTSG